MRYNEVLVPRMRFGAGEDVTVEIENRNDAAIVRINGVEVMAMTIGKRWSFTLPNVASLTYEPVGLIRGLFGWLW